MAYDFKIKNNREKTDALAEIVSQHDLEIAMLKRRTSGAVPMSRPRMAVKKSTAKVRNGPSADLKALYRAIDREEEKKTTTTAVKPVKVVKPVKATKYADLVGKPANNTVARPAPAPRKPLASSQPHVPDLPVFSKFIIEERLDDAVTRGDIEIFTQPVMRLPERQVRFYEIYTRLKVKPGLYIPAEQYGDLARKKNIQRDLDRLLLVRSLQMLKTASTPENVTPFFINLDPGLLKDAAFMRTLLMFAKQNRKALKQIYFELPHEYFLTMPSPLLKIMQGLGALGCNFALDQVKKVRGKHFDIQRLIDYKIRSVKISKEIFLDRTDPQAYRELMRVKNTLEGNGISVIAEKIESDVDLNNLMHLGLHYGQGYALGQPKPQTEEQIPVRRQAS